MTALPWSDIWRRLTADYRALLTAAGFHDIRVERPFDPAGWNSLITART